MPTAGLVAASFFLALALAITPAQARKKDHEDRDGRRDRGDQVDNSVRSNRDRRSDNYGRTLAPAPLADSFVERRPRKNAAQAAKEAQMRYGGGRVLSVDPAGDGYRVKLIRDGDVRIVFIPSR